MANRTVLQPRLDSSPEVWRAVPGYEGLYEVSDVGRVRSLDRIIPGARGTRVLKRGQVLRPSPPAVRNGKPVYPTVVLHATAPPGTSRPRTWTIHTLVMAAFGPPKPDGVQVVRHRNGDHSNNTIGNLSWGTYSDNAHDRVRHGRDVQTNRTHCPYRHELRDPNLTEYGKKRGHRLCLACSRARASQQQAAKTGRAFDFQESADARYAAIMRDGVTAHP